MKVYEGLKVLELADVKGMFAGKMLAAMGAEVLKVEQPGGNKSRRNGPFAPGGKELENSLSFAYFNTGKKSITLDIFSEEGRPIFLELVKKTDVIIETFKHGKLRGSGLGYEDLKKINPGLIMLSVTPFGQYGPHADWRADTDLIPDAMSGLMSTVGYNGQAPLHLGYDIQSCVAGMYGLFGLQAAYHNRLFTGEGAHIDVSLQECASNWTSQGLGIPQVVGGDVPRRKVDKDAARQALVNCKDGLGILMIGGKWLDLLQWFRDEGVDTEVFKDTKYEEHIHEVLTPWDIPLMNAANELASKYTTTEFMEEGQRRRIPCGQVSTPAGMLNNKHLKERGFFIELDHPEIGKRIYPGAPIMFTESPMTTDRPAPLLGQDNDEVFGELGIDSVRLAELKKKGIV